MNAAHQAFIEAAIIHGESHRAVLESDKSLEYYFRPFIEQLDAFYDSFKTPFDTRKNDSMLTAVPRAVKRAIVLYFKHDIDKATAMLLTLQQHGFGSDLYWGIAHAGMFIGIEPDGYMHS